MTTVERPSPAAHKRENAVLAFAGYLGCPTDDIDLITRGRDSCGYGCWLAQTTEMADRGYDYLRLRDVDAENRVLEDWPELVEHVCHQPVHPNEADWPAEHRLENVR